MKLSIRSASLSLGLPSAMKKKKPNNQIVRKAACASGLLLLLIVVFTDSSLKTERFNDAATARSRDDAACDVARGEWVPDSAGPYYTNATCPLIDGRQDCMKYGKPGIESIVRWRWQPHGCDLPRFDAAAFLRLVRGKSMAFVGDSVARNHMQSLMCLLAKVPSYFLSTYDRSRSVQSSTRHHDS